MLEIFYFLFIALGINIVLFIPAFLFKTDKLTDLSYSLTFALLMIATFFLTNVHFAKIVVVLMVLLWSIRLGTFLLIRISKAKKDKRFDGIRESFPKFLMFWVLQAVTVWVLLLPVFFYVGSARSDVYVVGFFIWAAGFMIESSADLQKYQFKQQKKNKDSFIQTGLWRFSRHPNYFGEILCWVGIYVFVLPSLPSFVALIGLISPLFITILLMHFTGLPQLEDYADKKWGKTKKYQTYKENTNVLIPWIPRK